MLYKVLDFVMIDHPFTVYLPLVVLLGCCLDWIGVF